MVTIIAVLRSGCRRGEVNRAGARSVVKTGPKPAVGMLRCDTDRAHQKLPVRCGGRCRESTAGSGKRSLD